MSCTHSSDCDGLHSTNQAWQWNSAGSHSWRRKKTVGHRGKTTTKTHLFCLLVCMIEFTDFHFFSLRSWISKLKGHQDWRRQHVWYVGSILYSVIFGYNCFSHLSDIVNLISTRFMEDYILQVYPDLFSPNSKLLDSITNCAFIFTEGVLLSCWEVPGSKQDFGHIKPYPSLASVQQGKEEKTF